MPRKKENKIDSKIQEKLEYIGLNLDKIPKRLLDYTSISFKALKDADEKKFKQYRYINIKDIEILMSPTNHMEDIKTKYERAKPLCYYLDSKNEENIEYYTQFLKLLNKVNLFKIQQVEEEQKMLSKQIPFKIKFTGNYLWEIYYSEAQEKYFMIVPTEDSDYSTFFYILKKKIENKKQEKIFVPISLVDYEEKVFTKDEIRDLENYLWVFTKDYPLIYEVWDKNEKVSVNIVGETEIYEKIRTLYKISISNKKDASKFYKLLKALFILQTELPHYYKFETNVNEIGELKFSLGNSKIEYENLPEFITEQYLKSISLRNKTIDDLEELHIKLNDLKDESETLEKEYISKEKQISTYLECKKTFFGKVKYFFKIGKKNKKTEENAISNSKEIIIEEKKEKIKIETHNYTLYELEESFKELEQNEEEKKNLVMDINALKLKNKNLKKKIENASNYIEEINKHKKSIFEFWKYSNKDAVVELTEGEQEDLNVSKIVKIFNFEKDFEEFGKTNDKLQRNIFTDDELDSCFIASTDILDLINKVANKKIDSKEISEYLKQLKNNKQANNDIDENDEEAFNIFGRINPIRNIERTIGNKVHRESPRNKYDILDIKKGLKGVELKEKIENIIKNINTALEKNSLEEDLYGYIVCSEKINFNELKTLSLNVEEELNEYLKNDETNGKAYLYKIYLPKRTNYVAFTNIVFFDNKNMTLPVGMDLSTKILVDLSQLEIREKGKKVINKLQIEEENDFAKIEVKEIEVKECESRNGSEKIAR